jgi:hypothetical protein
MLQHDCVEELIAPVIAGLRDNAAGRPRRHRLRRAGGAGVTSTWPRLLALAIALTGCADWNNWHATSQFPPTPNVETAWHTCHEEVSLAFLPENMAWAAAGPIGQLVAGAQSPSPKERITWAMRDCMTAHGWDRNSE